MSTLNVEESSAKGDGNIVDLIFNEVAALPERNHVIQLGRKQWAEMKAGMANSKYTSPFTQSAGESSAASYFKECQSARIVPIDEDDHFSIIPSP